MREAIERVGLDADLKTAPQGLDTLIEQLGQNLSSGQRRRLGLARVLLRSPKLLILDEPFANVSPTERGRILDAILRIPRSVTLCVISHEHELIADFDKVIEVRRDTDGGRTKVVELPARALMSGSERRPGMEPTSLQNFQPVQ